MCFWTLEFHATHCKDKSHYELRECDFKLNFALSSKYLLNPLTLARSQSPHLKIVFLKSATDRIKEMEHKTLDSVILFP